MVRVATGAIDELHGKGTVLFAKRRRSSRVKRVWRKAVAQRQRALNGAGEALRLKFIIRLSPAISITYDFGQFLCWTYCWTFRSPLNLARVPLKTRPPCITFTIPP